MSAPGVRGRFLARPVGGDGTMDILRRLAAEEGFAGSPEDYLSVTPGPEGFDAIAVTAELGENLLACARWRGVLTLKKV